MSERDSLWVRSVRYHSYHNVLREPDTYYQVDSPEDLETVTAQQVAVREAPPAKAKRPTPPAPAESVPDPIATTEARVMTTADLPQTRTRFSTPVKPSSS